MSKAITFNVAQIVYDASVSGLVKTISFITTNTEWSAKDLLNKESWERLVYSEMIRRKQAEALSWQINKKDNDDDGGFCAEKPNDVGGVWTTAETVFVMLKYKLLTAQDSRMQRAKNWLLRHQNLGGDYGSGWPLINRGNSFVDTTARAVLALAYFKDDPEVKDSLRRAKDWLLENQNEDGGWGIWKYEDSLVSATSFTLLAFRCLVDIFPEDENIKLSILRAAAWLKNAQDPKSCLWGFTPITKESQVEPNNASTRMAVYTLYKLGEDLAEYLPALGSFIEEFKKEGRWQTISETYTLKYFGEGLDQRLSWFNAPFMVLMLVRYARCVPGSVDIKKIIDGAESLKVFDSTYQGREVTDISPGNHDIRPWASVQFLCGLLEAESYLQNNLDEYVTIMDKKVAIIEKAGMLQSMPLVSPFKKQTGVYVSMKFLMFLIPTIALSLIGVSYLTYLTMVVHEGQVIIEEGIMTPIVVSLFAVYMVTFFVLVLGYKQNIISKSRFAFLYLPIWALVIVSTILFFMERLEEGLVVLLLIGFPEILSLIMNKSKHSE